MGKRDRFAGKQLQVRKSRKRRARIEMLEKRELLAGDLSLVDDADAHFSFTGNWGNSATHAYGESSRYASGSDGSKVASWTFEDLEPGKYQLAGHWGHSSNRASNVNLEILQEGVLQQVVTVDQRVATHADLYHAGVSFEHLGQSITVTGDELTVRISNEGADGLVIADAMLLLKVGPAGEVHALLDRATFAGSSSITQDSRRTLLSDDFVPVDANGSYHLSVELRSGDGVGGSYNAQTKHRAGFASYDADHNLIERVHHVRHRGATDTTLASAIVPGDTQIHLADASGWYNGRGTRARTLAWYGYTDGNGYVHPDYTYTRHVLEQAWAEGGIDESTGVVTLRQPWSGPIVPAGTAIRNTVDGFNYQSPLVDGYVSDQWGEYNATLSGDQNSNDAFIKAKGHGRR